MIDNPFRQVLPKYSSQLIRLYKYLRLTPNHITLLGVLIGFFSAFLVSRREFIWAGIVWWCGRLLDGTDGIYARAIGQSSGFGAFLDILSDMAAYSSMIVGFAIAFPEIHFNWMAILFLYVLCITGALSLGNLEDKNKVLGRDNRGLRLAAGIAEGGETGVAYTLFLLFPSDVDILSKVWILILMLTVISRILLARKELRL